MKKLIFTFGISGCGKSTWLADKDPVIETDQIRKEVFGSVNNYENDGYVFQEARKRIIENLRNNDVVYFGSTMVETQYRLPFLKEVIKKCPYDLHIEIVIFKSDPEKCKERVQIDLSKGTDRADSSEVIDSQYQFYIESLKVLEKEGIYDSFKYVGFDSIDEIKKL